MLRTLEEKVDPKHTALVVIDMQNDFCHNEGMYGGSENNVTPVQAIVPELNTLIHEARSVGAPVIFVKFILNKQVMSDVWRERQLGRDSRRIPCLEGSWGAELYGVSPEPGDAIVVKHRFSAFTGTDLVFTLQCRNIKTVVLTGIYTNICVEIAAKDAFMSDYYVVVAGDCTAAPSPEDQEASLARMGSSGVVTSASEIRAAWARRKSLQAVPA